MWSKLAIFLTLTCGALAQEAVPVPTGLGGTRLRPDDFTVRLGETQTIALTLPLDAAERQLVLAFRARIDNPGTPGSSNGIFLEVNGEPVRLRTSRREDRLLNKPHSFSAPNHPVLDWFLVRGDWRLSYAPDFEILLDRPDGGPGAYEFEFDISDLLRPGDNTIAIRHASNAEVAARAGSDLTLYFRDLRLDVRPGPGVRGGVPESIAPVPYRAGRTRSAPLEVAPIDAGLELTVRKHRYHFTSRFSAPGKAGVTWLSPSEGRLQGPGWRLERKLIDRCADGRLTIEDTFTSTADAPVGIMTSHELAVVDDLVPPRINFGGREEPDLPAINRPSAPWIFLGSATHGIGFAAEDDVFRQHADLSFDNDTRTAALHDDWFGLLPGESYTTRLTIYATDSANVFDLVNLIRADWLPEITIDGGITFFEPDAILAYDDTALADYLTRMNITIAMSQGGWVDQIRQRAGDKNVAHGPIVWSDEYADYRVRLSQAMDKLRRLKPGIRCLVYFDTGLVTGINLPEVYADSIWRNPPGTPFRHSHMELFNRDIAYVIPTLDNQLGRDILARLPGLLLDEMGADGLYWDEMSRKFEVDYGQPDGHTWRIDPANGRILAAAGAPELTSLPFKLALLDAFRSRGALIVANTTPTTATEQAVPIIRFNENSVAHHPGAITKCWMYTPVAYAGWSTYTKPKVTEADFLADIYDKLQNATVYLFSSQSFYRLFTHENLATYQYPLTPLELDHGVIVGAERILAVQSGVFGWPGEPWSGELVRFDAEQKVRARQPVAGDAAGLLPVDVPAGEAMVILRDPAG